MSKLAHKNCTPCRSSAVPLKGAALTGLLEELGSEWTITDEHHLSKTYSFADFAEALALVNRIGKIAEEQGHHPDIYLAWGVVRVDIWSHSINGLTESDFILAAKIDQMVNA